jgi:uncharacterized protein (TIGR02145 family)
MLCMKNKNRIWIYSFIVTGIALILFNSCKKDLNNTKITIGIDQDSIFYPIEAIGTQVWMTRNLRVRRYQNVDKIGTTTPAKLDITSKITPKYQWPYDGDESNVETYGRLYTWYAVADPRNLCPKGFHVPTDEEWTILISLPAMGSEDVGGGKLKETGTTHWITPNTGATNESGFTALPGGYRFSYGSFSDIGFSGFWWSSSEYSDSIAYGWGVSSYNSQVSRFKFDKRDGLSVRCITDN